MYIRMKVKITLSIRKDLIDIVRKEGKEPISKIVEEALATFSTISFLEKFNPEFISPENVKKNRKKGLKAEDIIRELRDEGIS